MSQTKPSNAPIPLAVQQRIRELRLAGKSLRAIAAECDVPPSLAHKYGKSDPPEPAVPVDPVQAEIERKRKADELRAEREVLRDVAAERSLIGKVESLLTAKLDAMPAPKLSPVRPSAKDCSVETMLLHLSDWHFAEFVRPEGVFGLNEFNREIGIRRVRRVVESTINIKSRLERGGGYQFPAIVVACNGDFVSGTIHEVEKHTDAENIIDAVLTTGELLAEAIRSLADHFPRVYVFGTSGNHGRLPDAKKVQTKEPTRSWDYLVYRHAAARLRDCPTVQIETPNAWAAMYEVEGRVIYQGHGHFVKSWNSIPFYGINRLTSRLSGVLCRHLRPVDYWLFGHFHTPGGIENSGGKYLINPALIGPQEFGLHSMGEATAPGQSLMSFNRKYGKTWQFDLQAEEVWPPPGRKLELTSVSSS